MTASIQAWNMRCDTIPFATQSRVLLSRLQLPFFVSWNIITVCVIYFSLDVQAQCFAHCNGGSSDGLRAQLAVSFLYPCRRIRVAERTRWVSASTGPRRRSVQFIFSLEGHRRIHQHVFLVPGVCHDTRRPSTKVLQGCKRMVARGRRVHYQLMARTRSRTSTEYLKRNRPGIRLKGSSGSHGEIRACVRACVRPPTTRCSISTNDSDSSKTEHCLSLKGGRKLQRMWYCAVTSKKVARGGSRPPEDVEPIVNPYSTFYLKDVSANVLRMLGRSQDVLQNVA